MRSLNNELRELDLFSGVSRAQLAQISQHLTRLTLPAGRVLVHEGAVGDEFLILVEGRAEVSRDGRVIATLGRGDLVGELALLHEHGRGRRNATVTAVTDVAFYVGSRSGFRSMISAAPSVAEKVHLTATARTPIAA